MKLGIVGSARDKFTPETKLQAILTIKSILSRPGAILVSGRCPMGGIDVWAETMADKLNIPKLIFPPKVHRWEGPGGFRERDLQIAEHSDEVHVIVPSEYPHTYAKRRFTQCYHCNDDAHIKSGGCWTARQALNQGKFAEWHIL